MKKIGYQGILGSFSQIATEHLFPKEEYQNYQTFKEVFLAIENKEIDYGVLPMENSYSGDVGRVFDLLFRSNLYIQEIYPLPIEQNLVGLKTATLEDIEVVYSHEQALMQCSDFLISHPFLRVTYPNTAMAARYIKEENDIHKASIASSLAAELYDLKILVPKINNNLMNTTKFIVLGKEIPKVKNHYAFMFTTKDGAGSLANVLNAISRRNINLTTIKSRSTNDLLWKYYFYCEAEGEMDSENVKSLIKELSSICETFKLVGSF